MRVIGALVGTLIFLLPACRTDDAGSSFPDDVLRVDEAVCKSLAALVDGSEGTREVFMSDAHEGLHELAARLIDKEERSVAGDLLEAKQSVEAAFESETQAEGLRPPLATLLRASQTALKALGETVSACPQTE